MTTIGGSHSGYIEVELTQPLPPFEEGEPKIAFEGGGEVIGIALRPVPDSLGNADPVFYAYSAGAGELRGLRVDDDHDGTLAPPGRYRLHLIAERPGNVTIEFPTLAEGQLSVSPAVETPQRSGAMSTASSENVVKFSERVTLWGGGVIYMEVLPTPGIATELELCSYWPAQEEEAGTRAYDPGCPYGFSGYKDTGISEGEGAFSISSPSSDWEQGLGGNVTNPFGPPGTVDTYLFTAGYDLGPPPSSQQPSDPGAGSGETGSSTQTTTQDPPPGGEESARPEPTSSAEPPPAPAPPGPVIEPSCRGEPCGTGWAVATLRSRYARLARRRATVGLVCAAANPCRGKVGFPRSRSRSFELRAGSTATVRVPVRRALRSRVRRHGVARARLVVTSRLDGETVQLRRRVVIRPHR